MKTDYISKYFETLKQAEKYQQKLYEKYFHVELIEFPRFSDNGVYTWEVKNKKTKL